MEEYKLNNCKYNRKKKKEIVLRKIIKAKNYNRKLTFI